MLRPGSSPVATHLYGQWLRETSSNSGMFYATTETCILPLDSPACDVRVATNLPYVAATRMWIRGAPAEAKSSAKVASTASASALAAAPAVTAAPPATADDASKTPGTPPGSPGTKQTVRIKSKSLRARLRAGPVAPAGKFKALVARIMKEKKEKQAKDAAAAKAAAPTPPAVEIT